MAVTYVGTGGRVDSGGVAVTSINVPRPGGLAAGDAVLLWLWATHDGVQIGAEGDTSWQLLGGNSSFWVLGKLLPAGFAVDTEVSFFGDHVVVVGAAQVVYRGAYSFKAAFHDSNLAAPSVTPQSTGRAVRMYAAALASAGTLTAAGGQSTRVPGSSSTRPVLMSDAACTYGVPTGTANASRTGGAAATLVSATVVLGQNRPPSAPTLDSPADGAPLDRTITQRFSWFFDDPDDGASQSKFDLRYSSDGGATWTTVTGITPDGFVDIAGGTFALGSYQWQVRTYDQFGLVGPYSPSQFFTAAAHPDVPTITYPTSGGTVSQSDRVDWSYPDQEGYQVRRVADNAGSPDTGTIYYDSGQVLDTDTRSLGLLFPTNNRYEHIQVSLRIGGIWSDFADVRVLVSYTPPPVPDLVVSIGDDGVTHVCDWTNGDPPDEGDPATTSIDLEVSADGGATVLDDWPDSTGLPITGALVYPWPASGVEHCYRATAHADNGTTTTTEWIALFRYTVDEVV